FGFFSRLSRPPLSPLFPYTTLFRSNSAEGFYNQGNALMQLERYADAVLAYQAALNRRPNWPEAEENLALAQQLAEQQQEQAQNQDRKSTRLNSSHVKISYAVFCLKK